VLSSASVVVLSERARRSLLTTLIAFALSIGSIAVLTPPAHAIVGGEVATEEYSNMAAFLYDGRQICGASLIAPEWIISAAHCVDSPDASHYSFRIGGAANLDEPGDSETIQATQVIVHPEYDGGPHDIVLFQLERPSTYTPIRLADPVADRALWEPGDTARVIGYGGQFFQTPSIDGQLRQVDVPVVDDAECDASYDLMFGGIDEATEVCAGELHGTEDSCQGDSGGPLMVKDEAGAWAQMGVVSWGFGCGFPTQYGVYARVGDTTLYNWVQETVANTEPPPPPPPPGETTTVKVEPQGHIAAALPTFGLTGITENEFALTCSTDLVTQGADGYAWALPPELAVDGAIAKLTGVDSLFHDLDISFWDSDCGFLDNSSTAAIDEEAPVPAGTAYVLAHNFLGADVTVDLTVTIPEIDTATETSLELHEPQRGGPRNDVAAMLRDAESGLGIEGQTIEFFANCESIGAAVTSAEGITSIEVPPRYRAATTEFSAVFGGEESYAASRAGADC
jgi:hypothetical protein